MDKHKQRIKIAEACGWTSADEEYTYYGFTQNIPMVRKRWTSPDGKLKTLVLPDYLNDLNAMHEALLTLNIEQRHSIVHEVGDILGTPNPNDWQYHDFLYVSASELAEAFLKTLNLWEANK